MQALVPPSLIVTLSCWTLSSPALAGPAPQGAAGDVAFGQGSEEDCCRPIPARLRNSPDAVVARGGAEGDPLTIVLDFKEPGEPNTFDIIGNEVSAFDIIEYGFSASEFDYLADVIACVVRDDFFGIPAADVVAFSPLPAGNSLDIEIVVGDIGTPPSNGASEYYYIQIGSCVGGGCPLGQAALNSVRDDNGNPSGIANGSVVASTFTDNIQNLGGLIPSDALSSGDYGFTSNAVGGTTAHEIGHTVSLFHLRAIGAVTPLGLNPVMGTGALDLSNQARIFNREFAVSGENSSFNMAFHIQQLMDALGLLAAPDFGCYCPSLPNATGSPAVLSFSGDPSSSLVLTSAPVPNTSGQFFFGPMMLSGGSTLGDGVRCVGGVTTRLLPIVVAGMMMQPPNTATLTVNYTAPYAAGLTGRKYFQHWFRSGLDTGTGSNASSGLEISF